MSLPYIITLNGVAAVTWTNQPAGMTEAPGGPRCYIPLNATFYVRLTSHIITAGAAAAVLLARFSLDDGATWTDGPSLNIGSTGPKVSPYFAIPENLRTEVLASIWGSGGNATADPQFGLTTLQPA